MILQSTRSSNTYLLVFIYPVIFYFKREFNSKGIEYSLTIEEPLHFVLLPRSITSGILNIDVANIKDIKLNYTNSTITILGITYPFDNWILKNTLKNY